MQALGELPRSDHLLLADPTDHHALLRGDADALLHAHRDPLERVVDAPEGAHEVEHRHRLTLHPFAWISNGASVTRRGTAGVASPSRQGPAPDAAQCRAPPRRPPPA